MNRRGLMRAAVVAIAACAAAGAVEAGLRLAITRLPIPLLVFLHRDLKDAHPAVYARLREVVPNLDRRQEDMDLGWTFRPSARMTGTNEDGEAYDRTSTAQGFFSPDVPDPATHQLITLGDSFLSTFVVPQPIAWVMRDALGEPVYNLSVGGWGPESYRAAYEKFATGRSHSDVIVFTFVNDITDVANWASWQAEEVPGMSFLTWIQRANPDGEAINTSDAWLDRHSVTWNLLRRVAWRYMPGRGAPGAGLSTRGGTDAAQVERFAATGGGHFDLQFIDGLPFAVNDPEAFWPGGFYYVYLQSYFESLERLRHAIEARGARMTLVWIPSKERVYLPLLPADRLARHVTNATKDLSGLEQVMAQYARQAGLRFLDLTPALMAAARDGQRLYFTVDGHLNSAGNALVGRTVAAFLRQADGTPPPAIADGRRLPFRSGPVTITGAVTIGESQSRSALVREAAQGWVVSGNAESQYGYVAQWPERDVSEPMFVIVRGRVRRGGFTVGLLADNKWAATLNVTATGRFDVALPVMAPGRYQLTVAHCLADGDLRTDFEITEMGWSPIVSETASK